MFCPSCGQQQVSHEVRFCSRCGFPLDAVSKVLASGGTLPFLQADTSERNMSPRQKGIRQGAMLMLSTLLVVPLVAIISVFIFRKPEIFVPIAAISCFIGGLLRILYALLLESSAPNLSPEANREYVPPMMAAQMNAPARVASLPPSPGTPVSDYRPPQANTADTWQRPSVTEHTTRLLELDKPSDPHAQ